MNLASAFRYHWNVHLIGPTVLRAVRWREELFSAAPKGWLMEHLAPPLRINPRMHELVSRHYLRGRYAHLRDKVAWVTSGAPSEFLRALGFYVLYPENHAALCGTARRAVELCGYAEDNGYSRDLCSYARTDLGAFLAGVTPVGRLPKPDLLMACTNICQTVLCWYRVLAHYLNIPLIVIDTPFIYEHAEEHALRYVQRQLEAAVPVAERVAGRALDERRLRRITHLSKEACELWMQVLERARHRPAPLSVFDQFLQMAPVVELRGETATVDFYAALLRELDERIAHGVGAVRHEKARLLWDNLPVWYRMRSLAELLGKRGAALVASTYTNAWAELAEWIDPENPFESAARVYLHPILNRGTGDKLKTMQAMIEKYELDGVILHSDRSCKPYSIGQIDQREQLFHACHVPALLLDADHNDERSFSEEQVSTRLEAFLEMLGV